jgi:hypothetical protein
MIFAATLLFPIVSGQWRKRQFEKRAVYLKEIYRAVVNENTEREPLGNPGVKSLDEVFDDQIKERMKRDGIDWRDFRYFPQPDDAPDSNVLFSVTWSGSVVQVRKGGAIFCGRKKTAEPVGVPNANTHR